MATLRIAVPSDAVVAQIVVDTAGVHGIGVENDQVRIDMPNVTSGSLALRHRFRPCPSH